MSQHRIRIEEPLSLCLTHEGILLNHRLLYPCIEREKYSLRNAREKAAHGTKAKVSLLAFYSANSISSSIVQHQELLFIYTVMIYAKSGARSSKSLITPIQH